MAIYSHQWNECEYYRVARSWGKEQRQEYVPIDPKNPEKSLKLAKELDESWRQRQKAYYIRKAYSLDYHLDEQGKIRGLSRVIVRRRKKNTEQEVFRLRVKLPWEEKIIFTTVSIQRYGLSTAFAMAVDRYCECYGFDDRSELRQKLGKQFSVYADTCAQTQEKTSDRASEELSEATLKAELEEFMKKRKQGVIRGT